MSGALWFSKGRHRTIPTDATKDSSSAQGRFMVRIVRVTENIQFSPAPRYTFWGGDITLVPTIKYTPETSTSIAECDVFHFVCECYLTLSTNIPVKPGDYYDTCEIKGKVARITIA